jgi:alpha-tubulin suppressor-like RCC1 family protein
VASLRVVRDKKKKFKVEEPRFVCHSSSAGSRHTLIVLIDCNTFPVEKLKRGEKPPKRKTKVQITGLNQQGLCEEKGHPEPVDVELQYDYEGDRAVSVVAGRGRSYVLTEQGALYAFGNGNFGNLGNENAESIQAPVRVAPLLRKVVIKVAAGFAHTMALTDYDEVFSWGKNDKGQLGLGFESPYELKISQVSFGNIAKFKVTDISCGHSHSLALVVAKNQHGVVDGSVYAWGDESRGQLGSGDAIYRMRPQENRWLSKFLSNLQMSIQSIHAGGYHNLVLLRGSGQVVAWGANEYGQLGNGFLWDDPTPKIVNGLRGVTHLATGLRHNAAACDVNSVEVFTWGYNGSGELGLGDTDVRLQPTHVTAIKNTKVFGVSCGDRHTVVITSHKPITAKEDTVLKPYFKILEVSYALQGATIRQLLLVNLRCTSVIRTSGALRVCATACSTAWPSWAWIRH